MKGIREFLNTPLGRGVGVAITVVAVGAMVWTMKGTFGSSEAGAISADRIFIDATTGKSFHHELKQGETVPVVAPSGEKTGYPAELCYWTADGKIKDTPTAVLMNSWKGVSGPTFCPDCGRLVVPHNPRPTLGSKPPPTQAEYAARHSHDGAAEAASNRDDH